MLVYYAHPQLTYGTEQEQLDILALESLGFNVFNPGLAASQPGFEEYGMRYFDMLCQEHGFDAIFYRAVPDNPAVITYGTGYEVNYCLDTGLPAYEIVDEPKGIVMSKDQTGMHYARSGRADLAKLYKDPTP